MNEIFDSINSLALESSMLTIVLEGESEEDNPSKIKAIWNNMKDAIIKFWDDFILPKIKSFGKKLIEIKTRIGKTKLMVNVKKLPIIKKIIEKFSKDSKKVAEDCEKEYATNLVTSMGYITNVPKSALESLGDNESYTIIDIDEDDITVVSDETIDTADNMKEDKSAFKTLFDSLGKIFSVVMGKIVRGKDACVKFFKNDIKNTSILDSITNTLKNIAKLVTGAVTGIMNGIGKIVGLVMKTFKRPATESSISEA